VIVMRGADEAGEFVPSDRDAQHLRRDPAYALHFQEAQLGVVANAAHGAFRGLGQLSHSVPFT
jgi:hypothetical protein